jgi:hypothetical protein
LAEMGHGGGKEGGAKGSWLQARDQQGWRFTMMDQEPPFQLSVFSFISKYVPYVSDNMYLCAHFDKKRFLVQVKNKLRDGIQFMHLFLANWSSLYRTAPYTDRNQH